MRVSALYIVSLHFFDPIDEQHWTEDVAVYTDEVEAETKKQSEEEKIRKALIKNRRDCRYFYFRNAYVSERPLEEVLRRFG